MDVAVKLSEVFSLNFAQMQEIMHMYCLLKFFISLSYVLPTHWNVSDTFSLMFLRRHRPVYTNVTTLGNSSRMCLCIVYMNVLNVSM